MNRSHHTPECALIVGHKFLTCIDMECICGVTCDCSPPPPDGRQKEIQDRCSTAALDLEAERAWIDGKAELEFMIRRRPRR